MKKNRIFIGTSGWMYKGWHEKFYPSKEKNFLQYFAKHFDTVEINNSFYRMPPKNAYLKWKQETGQSFVFSIKFNREITHMRRLVDARKYCEMFIRRSFVLKEKRGPFLVQLPPSFSFKADRLEKFLVDMNKIADRLGGKCRFALEPRHKSWFLKENIIQTKKILKSNNGAFVFAHSKKYPYYEREVAPVNFVYVRLHGPEQFAASTYREKLLIPWAEKICEWNKKRLDVFVYFNNDVHGYAIEDSTALKNLVKKISGDPEIFFN